MSGEYKQSREDLELHLKETVEALQLSSAAFDEGFEGEAKRLAISIRVLVHDTDSSKSLLSQLQLKDKQFYNTALPRTSNNGAPYHGLVAIELLSKQNITKATEVANYKAWLDNIPSGTSTHWVNFKEWWNQVIFVDNNGNETTRKDIVCTIANKDGGAHVDPVLNEKYANLTRRNSLAWTVSSAQGNLPLGGPENAAVRQIAHEILRSLNPEMPTIKPKTKGVLFGGIEIVKSKKEPVIPKVGRNEKCPCGSGKKYKKCHGR
jgi:hypothetical protein